ncbi:response regulator transcription factor [Egibacter rhizosphaerae]|uniref:response regulator transcription factor n=1 Tax=Egibacter rhizosphaerae TaxID=1670831 RepID=UPI0013F145AC|nr:response regulator [Egibacter rhizosphaerae]
MRVLVVDDDVSVRAAVAVSIDDAEVCEASDGATALARMDVEPVDVVLLDVLMPDEDGFSVLERIRARRSPGPAVLMLTGLADELDHLAAYRLGADGYLTKPVDPDDLNDAVARAYGRTPEEREAVRREEIARAELLRTLEAGFEADWPTAPS